MVDERKSSLRFLRFLREKEDNSVEDAATAEQVADLYRRQEKNQKKYADNETNDEDDIY